MAKKTSIYCCLAFILSGVLFVSTAVLAADTCCMCTTAYEPAGPLATECSVGSSAGTCVSDACQKIGDSPDKRVCTFFDGGTCASAAVQEKIKQYNSDKNAKAETKPLVKPSLYTIGNIISLDTEIKLQGKEPSRYYTIPWIAQLVGGLYRFGVGTAAVLAVVMIVIGGFIWMTSGGDSNRISSAKSYITGSIIGLVLALGSYSILYLVNPELVYLRPIKIPYIETEKIPGLLCPTEAETSKKTFTAGSGSQEIKPGEKLACGTAYLVGYGPNDGTACVGSYCPSGQMCLPEPNKDKALAVKNDLIAFSCQTYPQNACNSIDDSGSASNWLDLPPPNPQVDDEESQAACDIINQIEGVENKGKCVFVDANGTTDGCAWCSNEAYKILDPSWLPTDDMKNKGCQYVDISDDERTTDKVTPCKIKKCVELGGTID